MTRAEFWAKKYPQLPFSYGHSQSGDALCAGFRSFRRAPAFSQALIVRITVVAADQLRGGAVETLSVELFG